MTAQDPMVAFDQSRAADLATVHRAIAALAEAPDASAVHDQDYALNDLLRTLHPTMISEAEYEAFRVQVAATAACRVSALGI